MRRYCLRCRKAGHLLRDCPEAPAGEAGVDGGGRKKAKWSWKRKGAAGGTTTCYVCGGNHNARDCPQATESSSFAHATCFVCGERGHIVRECPQLEAKRKAGLAGGFIPGVTCYVCGQEGHIVRECPQLEAKRCGKAPGEAQARKEERPAASAGVVPPPSTKRRGGDDDDGEFVAGGSDTDEERPAKARRMGGKGGNKGGGGKTQKKQKKSAENGGASAPGPAAPAAGNAPAKKTKMVSF